MPSKKRPAKKKNTEEPPAKRPARAARRNDDPVWSTTNRNSQLVNEDLHAKFSNPRTYDNWTKEDWEEMRAEGLPENAPYNEDGYSVPMEFFKYDADWRRLVREFQEDLGAGRYEPEWQEQAAQAMEERARGDFDKYKDDQFEEFWGQKQRTPWKDLAGESSKIKLEELVEEHIIREGDIFSYARTIGKGKDRVLIEKDAEVVNIDGNVLTMAIPPGRLKYARYLPTPQATPAQITKEANKDPPDSGQQSDVYTNGVLKDESHIPEEGPEDCEARSNTPKADHPVTEGSFTHADGDEPPQANTKESQNSPLPNQSLDLQDANRRAPRTKTAPTDEATPTTPPSRGQPSIQSSKQAPPQQSMCSATTEQPSNQDVIHYRINTLNEFERRLIEIDGRLNPKEHKNANAWKAIRGKRNNQDLGTLFEMREEYFVRRSPKIVKMPNNHHHHRQPQQEQKKTTRSGREAKPSRKIERD
ncbi:MAG: hypothetical protein Q9163_002878 [Psora crenata]